MPSNHLILCGPLLHIPSIFPSIEVFSNESVLCIRWPKYWSFSFNISPCNEYSGLISLRMGRLKLFAVQGTFKSLLQHHISKASVPQHSAFFYSPALTTIHAWLLEKNIALTRQTLVGKVMFLLFNMLSRLVIAFLPRNNGLIILWLQSLSAVISEPKKIKSATVFIVSPSICHKVTGLGAMILIFWMLSFKPAFSLSSFTFIKRLFSSFLLSAVRVVSSAYLRSLIFLPVVLITACASSSLALHAIYSAYKLNKQGDNIQPGCTPFPIWNQFQHQSFQWIFRTDFLLEPVPNFSMSSSNCCFLICIQISQEAGQVVWYSHFFKNFPQFVVIHPFKGFGIVNKTEVNIFLEFSCFFDDPEDVGNLIFGSSAFSKSSFNICKSWVHILLQPSLENFEHYFASVWDEYNCAVVWPFFGIAFLCDWNENWPFPVLWPLLSFPHLPAYWVQHCHSGII